MNDSLEHIAALISQGRPDLACPLAEKARARFPDSLDAARLHGVALLSTGQVTAAITALKQALAIDDQSGETPVQPGLRLACRRRFCGCTAGTRSCNEARAQSCCCAQRTG
ncbi:MAG: tetratricopeptide repeat protein [Dokdonella sp.]|nr:tetratricopeptide repeat protein [Dokdonella sp.]